MLSRQTYRAGLPANPASQNVRKIRYVIRSPLIFFGVAVFWTYLLALLSIKRLSAMLCPRRWRMLRTIGVEFISFAFLFDFAKNPFHGGIRPLVSYLPYSSTWSSPDHCCGLPRQRNA